MVAALIIVSLLSTVQALVSDPRYFQPLRTRKEEGGRRRGVIFRALAGCGVRHSCPQNYILSAVIPNSTSSNQRAT